MKKNYDNFPTLEQAKKSIERLEKFNWPKFTDFKNADNFLKKIQKIIFEEFEILPNIMSLFKPTEFTLPLFRARELSSFTNANLFAEHSYPPVNLTEFNRCNFPNSPVFYCSDHPIVALIEIIKNNEYKKKTFCISKWELIESEEKFVFQSFLHTELPKENHYGVLKDKEIEQFDRMFQNNLDKNRKAGLIEYLKFLHSAFISDQSYALSATLAHRSLKAEHNHATDILMYPSIQIKRKGVNMAIAPNFVDNMMRIQRLYIVNLKSFNLDTGESDLTVLGYGDIQKNVIVWKKPDLKDKIYKKYYSLDFKHLIDENLE